MYTVDAADEENGGLPVVLKTQNYEIVCPDVAYRNRTNDRFRRAFICHYANESATRISHYYRPFYRVNGEELDLEIHPDGGPCGKEFENVYPH